MPQTENLPNGVVFKISDLLKLKVNSNGQVLSGCWRVIAARKSESLTVPAPLRCSTRILIARLLSTHSRLLPATFVWCVRWPPGSIARQPDTQVDSHPQAGRESTRVP